MKPTRDSIEHWLAAEAAAGSPDDGTQAAETALGRLFEALPRLAPPAGFAERVMARLAPAAAPWWAWERLAAGVPRWATAALLLLAGSMLMVVPAIVSGLLAGGDPGQEISWLSGGVFALADWVRGGFAVWETFARIGEALAAAAATPRGAMALAAVLAVATLAFRLLNDLIARERSWSHVQA